MHMIKVFKIIIDMTKTSKITFETIKIFEILSDMII